MAVPAPLPTQPEYGQPTSLVSRETLWNILSMVLLLGILMLVAWMIFIFMNPASPANFLPPPTQAVAIFIPSETPLPKALPPTWTPTAPPTAAFTPTFRPTDSAQVIATATLPGGATQVVTITPQSNAKFPFALQAAPAQIFAQVLYPDRNCSWAGLGGQALDLQGRPATGITVQLYGMLDKNLVSLTSLTGTATTYGPAGYEFSLGDKPIASTQSLMVRLLDQAGIPLSANVYFDTSAECSTNLVVINFRQVR